MTAAEFDLVISLFMLPGHGPDPQVEHVALEIPDAALTAEQIRGVQELALRAVQAVRDGRTALVRCNSGFNRCGLVVAQTLIELGLHPEAAVAMIRRKRSRWALNNRIYVEYLATELDVAGLLAGLEAPV